MLISAKLDAKLWSEAILCAACVYNRTPSSGITKLAAKMWIGRVINYSRLKIFGWDAYVHNKIDGKFNSRSNKLIFVGYSLHEYRL